MGNKIEIAQALAVAAELTGTALSEMAFDVMVSDLAEFETDAVLNALNRCRRELTGRLTLAAVLERIDDGLPSADEAWGLMVEGLKDEALTVVVPEIAQIAAGNGATQLFRNGDKTGARMAFREAYGRLAVGLNPAEKVRWVIERGYDAEHAKTAIMEAVRQGRIEKQAALMALPSQADDEREKLETGRILTLEQKRAHKQRIAPILKLIADKKAMQC